MHRFLRLTSVLAIASCGAACSSNAQVVAYVIAPDGGDPFLGNDAATQARVTLENDASMQTTVPVMSDGSFRLDIHPASSIEVSRLRVEALRNGEVIATGVTTPVQWGAQGGDGIPVLMQFRDSVIAAPQPLPDGRADCQLLIAGGYSEFIGCFTFPSAQNLPGTPAVYDVMHQLPATFAQTVPGEFTGDATIALAGGKIYVLQGAVAVQYTGDPHSDSVAVDVSDYLPHNGMGRSLREGLVRSSVYHSDDGGWLLGGNVASVPSQRVDHFTSATPDGGTSFIAFDVVPPEQLIVARSAPQIVELSRENVNPRLLVAGGNASSDAFLELYRPMGQDVNRRLSLDVDTNRTNAAIACIHSNPDPSPHCDRVIVLGGRNGTAAGDDLLLDVEPLQHGGAGDPVILQRGRWLVYPRDNAHLGLAEGGRLLVAGGDDASGAPVRALEVLDVHDANAAPTSLDLHTDACEHPMVAGVSNGSVIIMGGTLGGVPCTDISFYRH